MGIPNREPIAEFRVQKPETKKNKNEVMGSQNLDPESEKGKRTRAPGGGSKENVKTTKGVIDKLALEKVKQEKV